MSGCLSALESSAEKTFMSYLPEVFAEPIDVKALLHVSANTLGAMMPISAICAPIVMRTFVSLALRIIGWFLHLVEVHFVVIPVRERYCCQEIESTVVVFLCCQLAVWFVVDCRCQQRLSLRLLIKKILAFSRSSKVAERFPFPFLVSIK